MNQNVLQLNVSMDYIFVMKVSDGLDQLKTDISNFIQRKRVVVFDVLEKGLFATIFNYQRYLGKRLN